VVCLLYTIALSAVLGLIAWLVERALPETAPRRWLWLAAVVLSVTIPPIYIANHHVVVTRTVVADTTVWSSISVFDPEIMRVWLVTTIALALWGLVGLSRLAWLMPKRGGLVIVHPNLGPATVGLLRTRVVIPPWVLALPEAERYYVLRHEHEHQRAHDTQLLFFASLTVVAAPWNIALWWLLRRLSVAAEIDCDNRVLAARPNTTAYGELLLKVAARENSGPRVQPAFLGGTGMLERRLRHMLAPARLSRVQRILAVIAASVLLMIALATPHPVLRSRVEAHHVASSSPR
jgi:bla regulator protein blaR1